VEQDYLYYPGCTLVDHARAYDTAGRAAAEALDVHLTEMTNWTCCGTTLPLTTRRIAGLVAPVRTLVQAGRAGRDELLTLCSFCYNVFKRANHAVREDALQRRQINAYLADEFEREGEEWQEYDGGVEVLHLLEVLRDRIGFDTLADRTVTPLSGLRVAPYYGCMLLRPHDEIGLDDPGQPRVLEDVLQAIGCEVIDFPHRVECCGSYLGLSARDVALETSHGIVESARELGADVLALACPLCAYNLERRQEEMPGAFLGFQNLPALYFTELLALALTESCAAHPWSQHTVDPMPLLRSKNLV
jgi:heterodisulfide reductase subunit B